MKKFKIRKRNLNIFHVTKCTKSPHTFMYTRQRRKKKENRREKCNVTWKKTFKGQSGHLQYTVNVRACERSERKGRLLGLCKDNRQGTYSKTFQCRVAVVAVEDNAEKMETRKILEADAGAYNDIPLLPSLPCSPRRWLTRTITMLHHHIFTYTQEHSLFHSITALSVHLPCPSCCWLCGINSSWIWSPFLSIFST